MRKAAKFFQLLSDYRSLRSLVTIRFNGYLYERGWFEANNQQASVDRQGNPVPWLTYPSVTFLDSKLGADMEVCEFGAGNSTRYFARRVKRVVSIEHDEDWYQKVKQEASPNVDVRWIPLDSPDYPVAATGNLFHLIVVDGRRRSECIRHSMANLRDDGVMILDDSERGEYSEGIRLLTDARFKRLDFWGIAPGILDEKCTTVFYRSSNCFQV